MNRGTAPCLLLAAVFGCEARQADVIFSIDESTAGLGGGSAAPSSTEPTCDGEILQGELLREFEILLGRLMMWEVGTLEDAQEQEPVEIARYFGVDAPLAIADVETLGREFLETLNVDQRTELETLAREQTQDLQTYRAARNSLIAELWAIHTDAEPDTDPLTALAAQAGRNEGKLALRYVSTFNDILASLTPAQQERLGQVLTGEDAPTPPSPEVEDMLRGADRNELLALAVKAYAKSQAERLPPGESERRIASYFGFAYFEIDKDSPDEDGAAIRSRLASEIYGELDEEQRSLMCATLSTQEPDIEAFQETRSSFVSSVFDTPTGDEETLLALHATIGSSQGRIGRRQAQLYQTLTTSFSSEQREAIEGIYLTYGAPE